MTLTPEQKFLYTRIAILLATAGWLTSAYAGFQGARYWYGGFVLCFWIAFGLLNYKEGTSLYLARRRTVVFLAFYAALVATMYLADQLGLRLFLWYYPYYGALGYTWLYLVLYPAMAFSLIEFLYFVGARLGAALSFVTPPPGRMHLLIDRLESVVFLLMMGLIVLGAAGNQVSLPLVALVTVLWILLALVKLRLHVRHSGHYLLAVLFAVLLATVLNEYQNLIAREWVYLPHAALEPVLSVSVMRLPLWIWLGWFWLTLVPLRLWIFLVLHPKVR